MVLRASSSGDARNGGAIDPIIRSSWGQGRIPVLVDDTEQAITIGVVILE